jgi:hypothetical protein
MLTSRITAAPSLPRRTTTPASGHRPPHEALGLAVAVVEAMIGRRPLHHLRSRLTPEAFQQLASLRASGKFSRSQVRGLRSQMPTKDAVEVSIKVSLAGRWLVCVLRLDRRQGWGCSDFLVLGADR